MLYYTVHAYIHYIVLYSAYIQCIILDFCNCVRVKVLVRCCGMPSASIFRNCFGVHATATSSTLGLIIYQ